MAEPATALAASAARFAAVRTQGLALREIPGLAYLTLRGDQRDAAFATAVAAATALALPAVAGVTTRAGALTLLWQGPDEWLLVGGPGGEGALVAALEAALAGLHATVVDVTGSRAAIELAGPAATGVLRKGCALDLHPRGFAVGACAQTILARSPVVIELRDATPTWRLILRRSFACHVADWLLDAATEPA